MECSILGVLFVLAVLHSIVAPKKRRIYRGWRKI